jgi:hypothetical protein
MGFPKFKILEVEAEEQITSSSIFAIITRLHRSDDHDDYDYDYYYYYWLSSRWGIKTGY